MNHHEFLVLQRRYYDNTGENESDSCDDGTATRCYWLTESDIYIYFLFSGAAFDLPKILYNIMWYPDQIMPVALVWYIKDIYIYTKYDIIYYYYWYHY